MTLDPGIHDIPAERYHADDLCEGPTLSASVAAILCQRSPAHAREAHPRLNDKYERHEEKKFDVGTAAHALLLRGADIVSIVEHDSWRTNAAKEARDAARAEGLTPLLVDQWADVQRMVEAVRPQLEGHLADPPLLAAGQPERTLIWEEDGVTCRSMLDWLHDDHTAVDDLKTTAGSAHPRDWGQRMYGFGADIQVAFYLRGVRALTDVRDPVFRFVVTETKPPFAVSVVSLAPSALELANEKVSYAIATWRSCLESGEWPAYVADVAHLDAPSWEQARWLDARAWDEEIAA